MKNKLKRLLTSNPKDYWNILNSYRHPNDNKNTIDINSPFDYFKKLNSNGDENGELKGKKKHMYCAFIDFVKAFDSVWRIGLWQTLLSSNINVKCLE